MDLESRITRARAKARVAHVLLSTAGIEPGEAVVALWSGWREVDAAVQTADGLITQAKPPVSSSAGNLAEQIGQLKKSLTASFDILDKAQSQYGSASPVDLPKKDARKLARGLKRAVVLVESWHKRTIKAPASRFPALHKNAAWIGLGVFVALAAFSTWALWARAPDVREGLMGIYFSKRDFKGKSIRRVDPEIDFRWGPNAPMAQMPSDDFSILWQGCLLVKNGESKILAAGADDGILVFVDDRLAIDNGGQHKFEIKKADRPLEPGLHRISAEFTEYSSHARAFLGWSSKNEKPIPIPPDRLIPPGKSNADHSCPVQPRRSGR